MLRPPVSRALGRFRRRLCFCLVWLGLSGREPCFKSIRAWALAFCTTIQSCPRPHPTLDSTHHSLAPLSFLRMEGLRDCQVLCGPVAGPVYLEDCRGCTVHLASRQVSFGCSVV